MRLRYLFALVAVGVLGASIWAIWTQGGDAWIGHTIGLDNGAGPWYLFWSGWGANFAEYGILLAVIAAARKHNCHVKGCWRLSWKQFGDHALCRSHHPHGVPTAQDIAEEHAAAQAAVASRVPSRVPLTSTNPAGGRV